MEIDDAKERTKVFGVNCKKNQKKIIYKPPKVMTENVTILTTGLSVLTKL